MYTCGDRRLALGVLGNGVVVGSKSVVQKLARIAVVVEKERTAVRGRSIGACTTRQVPPTR